MRPVWRGGGFNRSRSGCHVGTLNGFILGKVNGAQSIRTDEESLAGAPRRIQPGGDRRLPTHEDLAQGLRVEAVAEAVDASCIIVQGR